MLFAALSFACEISSVCTINFYLLNSSPDQVKIEATVLEKTRGRKLIVFKKKRRKNYKLWRGNVNVEEY